MDKIEKFITRTKADIRHGGELAQYNFKLDFIELPFPEFFNSTGEYYSVAFHELIHWTSHESRLDWMSRVDPSKNYMAFRFHRAYGEVVADIGEGLLCIHFGLNPDTSPYRSKHLFDNFVMAKDAFVLPEFYWVSPNY